MRCRMASVRLELIMHRTHYIRSASFAAAVFLTLAPWSSDAENASWRTPANKSEYAINMQTALQKINCYMYPGAIKGEWGNVSIAGLADYVDRAFGGFDAVPAKLRNEKNFLAYVQDDSQTRCGSAVVYVGTCDKDEVVQKWLEKNKKIAKVSESLTDLSAQFGQVFATTEVSGVQETVGTEKILSKDLFLAAKLHLNSLITKNSIAGNESCRKCSVLADWQLLKRLAKPTQDLLSSKKDPTLKLAVDLMDYNFVKEAEANVESIRNYIAHIENDPLGAEFHRNALKVEVGDLIDYLDGE
jgi:hypothetical protein